MPSAITAIFAAPQMNTNPGKYHFSGLPQLAAAFFFSFLLLLLTAMNFLVYGLDNTENRMTAMLCGSEEQAPSNPAGPDEKTPVNAASFLEEYLHEPLQMADLYWSPVSSQYSIAALAKLDLVHFEIVSPPPDLT